MLNSERNLGIDVLRIISIIGVVFLHVLGHGGVLSLPHSPVSFSMVWFFEVLASPAVNVFVLVSGYIGYRDEKIYPRIKNIISLLFTVVFYSISCFLICLLFVPESFGLGEAIKNFMPTMFNRYWFFSAYFGLFILTPLLNLLVNKSEFKHAFIFLIGFSLFSVVSSVCNIFSINGGYSLIWFIFLYLVGAIVKKYKLSKVFSKKVWLIIVLTVFIITWVLKLTLDFVNVPILSSYSGALIKYVSPAMVVMAFGLLNLFSEIKCPPSVESKISFFTKSVFSVYLIHDNIYVRRYLISEIHNLIDDLNFISMTLSIIGIVGAIFITCVLIDKIRLLLFKILKIDKLTEKIERVVKLIINWIYTKINNLVKQTAE